MKHILLSTLTGVQLSLFAAATWLLSGCNGTAARVAEPVEKVDKWALVREKWVTKFEEISMLEFKTIYGR
jgi:hypothetical protein